MRDSYRQLSLTLFSQQRFREAEEAQRKVIEVGGTLSYNKLYQRAIANMKSLKGPKGPDVLVMRQEAEMLMGIESPVPGAGDARTDIVETNPWAETSKTNREDRSNSQ